MAKLEDIIIAQIPDDRLKKAVVGGIAGVFRGGHPPGGRTPARVAEFDPGRTGAGGMPGGSAARVR